MPFNHYAKIKRILASEEPGWTIRLIPEATRAKNFNGEIVEFPHYYRIYDVHGQPIKYCKFQQVTLLAKTLCTEVESLPIISSS